MKVLIEIDELYAEALKLMWRELKDDAEGPFYSRQQLIEFILRKTVDAYPEFLERARLEVVTNEALRNIKREKPMPYFGERSVKEGVAYMLSEEPVVKQEEEQPLSESEKAIMKEIFGDAYQPSPAQAVPSNKSDVPHETELPELPEM